MNDYPALRKWSEVIGLPVPIFIERLNLARAHSAPQDVTFFDGIRWHTLRDITNPRAREMMGIRI